MELCHALPVFCLVGIGVLNACGSEDDRPAAPPPPVALATRPESSLDWRACGEAECAEVEVPIDYTAPEAGSLTIAINRVRANADGTYRGVILINPGGPGAAGKAFVAGSGANLRLAFPGFDFVGFDPRGVGESAPLHCTLGINVATAYDEGGVDGVLSALVSESERCAAEDGELFQHMGSNQVVADIDRIREALGHSEINFLGISYGTRLGALYAQTFPEHTRAVVLDAPVAPTADVTEEVEGQFDALLQAHEAFFEACSTNELDCPADPRGIFEQILTEEEELGKAAQFLAGWAFLLASPPGRETLAQVLLSVASEPEGEPPPAVDEMMPMDLVPAINEVANVTTNCADNAATPPTALQAEALMASFIERSALFASRGLPALSCSGWQVQPDPLPPIAYAPRIPPVVIGGTEDSLTPLRWAEETAEAITGANLLLSDHYGHGATAFGGLCVFRYLRQYFADLEPVPAGTRCPAP